MDSNEQEKLKLLSKERAKKNAQKRMSQISGGDFSRGFGTTEKEEAPPKKTTTANKKSTKTEKVNNETATTEKKLNKKLDNKTEKETETAHLGKIVVDSSAINTITHANTDSRRRRKKLFISLLIVAIVLIWAFIIITKLIKPEKPNHNCHMYLAGNAKTNCELLLDGKKNTEWHTPTGISPQCTYHEFTIELNILNPGSYKVRFRVEVYNKDKLVSNFGTIDTLNTYSTVVDSSGTSWRQLDEVQGGQKVLILSGLTFYDTLTTPELSNINSNNIKINVFIEVDLNY